jgi:hypothetical protein
MREIFSGGKQRGPISVYANGPAAEAAEQTCNYVSARVPRLQL